MKRADHLPLKQANPGKIRALLDVLHAFRAAAPEVAADQWRRFFETGRFSKMVPAAEEARSPRLAAVKLSVGAVRTQMLRHQVVGQLDSFMSNRANDFKDIVLSSTVDDVTRHQLLMINRMGAWFSRQPVEMRAGPLKGEAISPEVRALARAIMRSVLSRHRRPDFRRLNPWIDQRQAEVIRKETGEAGSTHSGLWAVVRGMERAVGRGGKVLSSQKAIALPLKSYGFFEARGGDLAKTIQLIERPAARNGVSTHRMADGRPGELVIGLVSDMEATFADSRKAWAPLREELALDFGLKTMFATPDGDLLGRAWMEQLAAHDRRIDGLARRLQRQGLKPNRSRRYRARVAAFRGFLKTEIGRVLNRLIQMKRPAHITLEKLDFRAPGLSRRLNRILARSGRAVIRAKLKDFEERYGITSSEVNPAYSSQTCSACGFVAKANRKTQESFSCRACGHEIHADVNAARNLESGRSAFDRSARLTKAQSLEATIRRHLERITTRDQVIPAAVFTSPYYRASKAAADDLLTRKLALPDPQDLGADVSAG